ncbi:MAG TPA: hypothetical protein VFJ67_07915, partial [Thermodesulfobacteriota bacterium]|nr:hypothetical protein [Thermodesulfobacteriota bacterium]
MTTILNGSVTALFAFDIGYEVALEQLSRLPSSAPVQPLSPKKRTPTFLQYSKPPLVVQLGETRPILSEPGRAQVTVFDFGAASIAYQWSLPSGTGALSLADLQPLSRTLYELNLEARAKEQIQVFLEENRSAIDRPELSPLVEDYYLFIIEDFDQHLSAANLLERHGSLIAQVLRFETQPLSLEQQAEALNQRLSYYTNDLVIVDWNAALVYDRDYHDTVNVLELLNVELLEARYIDEQLDRRISDYQRIALKQRDSLVPLHTPNRKAIQALAELRLESLVLAEKVDNALKLIGDLYLARVHALAARRLYLQDWESAISRKLDIIASLYQLLTDRVRTTQSQTLELIIIALILAEILMAVFFR